MQSHARALDGLGALLITRWAAYRRWFDSRWQPRVVHASKHARGCPARNPPRRSALSLESVWMQSSLGILRARGGELDSLLETNSESK